ncbi:PrsW family intramembrane metalloprotease [Nitratireductor thuwali]|uniref:PrsW family intramembrane metalloprotease n=1 Tax=Nitratireductor thuwali TaxID=2267699 RepID=A0ABY5MH32_9HYPH|nr:hypothetical protein NTH_00980 [Nitratireductor thuwali]
MNQRPLLKVDSLPSRHLVVATAGIFVATVLLVMLFQEAPLKQTWIYALCGLTVLVPYGIWITVLLHYDVSPPRPQGLLVSALAWGSLLSFVAAVVFEDVFDAIDALLGLPGLDTMVVAPFWEEFSKGLFIVLLYVCAQRHLRGPWDGLVYGALVGTGFGFAEDIAYLNNSLSDNGFSSLVATYVVREIFTAHAHPLFTAATGLAAGMAARQRLSPGKALWWIFWGFLLAFILHAIFDSATLLAPFTLIFIAPAYGVLFVIALRRLQRREIIHRDSTDVN